ncbi:ABC-transporter-regulating transcription factor [Paramyrothecium foliicola]|nr:ABC-transporter-regulating transcription factor [Paramyrothecium foliicola]
MIGCTNIYDPVTPKFMRHASIFRTSDGLEKLHLLPTKTIAVQQTENMPFKRACDICYKRKCITPTPDLPCNWCTHQKIPCTFDRAVKKKNRAKPGDVQELFSRIDKLESALAEATAYIRANKVQDAQEAREAYADPIPQLPTPGSPATTTTSPHSNAAQSLSSTAKGDLRNLAFGQVGGPGNHFGLNWFYKGLPILSDQGQQWISSKTGHNVDLGKYQLLGSQAPSEFSLPNLVAPSLGATDLPSRVRTEPAIRSWLESPLWLQAPIVDKSRFHEVFELAYSSPIQEQAKEQHTARACVLAALAVATCVRSNEQFTLTLNGDELASQAGYLLHLISGRLEIVSLETLLLLQLFHTLRGHWAKAYESHVSACRVICQLGGHVYQPVFPQHTSVDEAYRLVRERQLFWLCYVWDKDISLRSGYPALLTEDYCDLTPPDGNNNSSASHPSPVELSPLFPSDHRLSHIKERICRLLYSHKSYKLSDAELLLHIRRLDEDLQHWRVTVPLEFRPKLAISPSSSLRTTMSQPQLLQYTHLQLEYHYLLIAIHSVVRRCGASVPSNERLPEDLHNVVHSSIDISLEASRSTLNFIQAIIQWLREEAFW